MINKIHDLIERLSELYTYVWYIDIVYGIPKHVYVMLKNFVIQSYRVIVKCITSSSIDDKVACLWCAKESVELWLEEVSKMCKYGEFEYDVCNHIVTEMRKVIDDISIILASQNDLGGSSR